MSSSALYAIGLLVVIVGVIYVLHLAHMPQQWTIGLVILLAGAGIIGLVNNTKKRDG